MLEKKVECECPFTRITVGTGASETPRLAAPVVPLLHPAPHSPSAFSSRS